MVKVTPLGVTDAYIAFGSNMGERKGNILRALEMLHNSKGVAVCELSTMLETLPLGIRDQNTFINAVAKVKTSLDAVKLQAILHEIENRLGRVRLIRWGPRIIDLDILYYGNKTINTPTLKVPHPEITNRPFILDSLNELRCPYGPWLSYPNGVRIRPLSKKKGARRGDVFYG